MSRASALDSYVGPDVSMVVALSLDTAGSSPRYIPAILPDNVQVNIQQANINFYFYFHFLYCLYFHLVLLLLY